jgi:hypothetical protein
MELSTPPAKLFLKKIFKKGLTFSPAYDIISSVGEIRQLLKGAERQEVAHQKKQPSGSDR